MVLLARSISGKNLETVEFTVLIKQQRFRSLLSCDSRPKFTKCSNAMTLISTDEISVKEKDLGLPEMCANAPSIKGILDFRWIGVIIGDVAGYKTVQLKIKDDQMSKL